MDNPRKSQSFSVDDIRKVREEDDRRYGNMSMEEIAKDIHKRAAEGHKILDEIKKKQHGHGDHTVAREQLLEGITVEELLDELPVDERE